MRQIIFLIVCIFLIIISTNVSTAYKQNPNYYPVHQYITKNATEVWPLISYEIKNHAENPINKSIESSILSKIYYSSGKDIITGSGEEDVPIIEAFQHFWESDNPNNDWDGNPADYNDGLNILGWYNQQSSSFQLDFQYWRNRNRECC